MHILLISSWYPSKKEPFNGNFVKRHAELIAQKHQVTVLNFISEDTKKIYSEKIQKENLLEISVYYPKSKYKIIQIITLRKAFLKTIKEINNVDLIHGNVILEKGLLFIWAKKHFKKPLFITEHGSYFFRENYKNLSLFQKMTIIQTMKNCDHFSCVSKVLKDEINYLFPFMEINIIPNSIDSEMFNISAEKDNEHDIVIKFIHISTLDNVKNPLKIIKAFENIDTKTEKSFLLKIIAEKTNPEILNYLKQSKIKNKISLIGPLEIEQVSEELKKSDCLVLFSELETFSCVVAEAWSCGIPVISTPVGIAKEMNTDLGILTSSSEIDSLSTCLIQFIEGQKVYDKFKIREYASQFSKEKIQILFDEFYALKK